MLVSVEQKNVHEGFEVVAEHVERGLDDHLVGIPCDVADVDLPTAVGITGEAQCSPWVAQVTMGVQLVFLGCPIRDLGHNVAEPLPKPQTQQRPGSQCRPT